MTKDEMEAENWKYGNNVLHILRLSSGNVAVFNKGYELKEIVSEHTALIKLSLPRRLKRQRVRLDD